MKKISVLTLVLLMLSTVGCAALFEAPALNPAEFKDQVVRLPSFSIVDSYVTNSSFNKTESNLIKKWKSCYNFKRTNIVQRSSGGGLTGVQSDTDTFTSKVNKISKGFTQLTLQYKSSLTTIATGPIPDDGSYAVVIDIKKKTNKATSVNFYGVYSYTATLESTKKWANGLKAACPRDE